MAYVPTKHAITNSINDNLVLEAMAILVNHNNN